MKADSDQRALWDAFVKEWPIERLRTMSLAEYASVGDDKSFIRWVESRLSEIGSIWGGSAFKFGIYRRADNEEKAGGSGRSYSEDYAWYTKYGNSAEEAFLKVRDLVVQTATEARAGNLEAIDDIDLGDAFKWKIAFHYQDLANPTYNGYLQPTIPERPLRPQPNASLPYSQLYRRLNGDAR
jgi:5-methylcytosine-specific restriction protein B